MLRMTAAMTANRFILVGPARGSRPSDERVRRYRLARLKVEPETRAARDRRFQHLKRMYD